MSQQPPQGPPEPVAPHQQPWGPPRPGPNPYGGQTGHGSTAPSVFKTIPAQVWARALLIALVFFAGSLIMAGITAALGVGAINMAADFTPEFDEFFPTGASWIVLTFQLLGMGLLSPLSIGFDITDMGMSGASGTIFFAPWLIPAAGITAVITTQRFLGGNLRVTFLGVRLLLAAIAGLSFATVVTILTATIRFRVHIDESLMQGSMWAHSASLAGFLVAAVLVGCTTYLFLLPQRGVNLQRTMTALAAVFEHVMLIAAVAAIALVITLLVQGETDALPAVLFALPNVALAAFSLVHCIPVTARSNEEFMTGVETASFTLFDAHPAVVVIGIFVMVLALGVVAFRWSLRTRFYAHAAWSWITLLAGYLVLGVLITFANGAYLSMAMFGESLRVSITQAAWGFLLWLVIGGVVQVLASYVMPQLAYRMPRGLLRVLGAGLALPPATTVPPTTTATAPPPPPPGPAPEDSDATEVISEQPGTVEHTTVLPAVHTEPIQATASEQAYQTVADDPATQAFATAPQHPDAWHVESPAEPRRMRRGTKVLLVSGLSLVVLAGLAWAAHSVLARTMFGPQHTAEAYLQAVVDGRAEDALAQMGPNVTDELRALATDEIYQSATNRPDRFELGDVTRDGSRATVEATLYQSGKAYPLELGLTTSGTQAAVFSDWALETGDVAGRAAYVSGPSTLTVNEVEAQIAPTGQATEQDVDAETYDPAGIANIAAESGQVLLPGTYLFSAPEGSKYLSHGEDLELTITPGEVSETPIEFSQSYTEAFETDVIAAVENRLESCLADRTIRVDECEAASWEDTSWTAMKDMVRTWEVQPEIEVLPSDADTSFGGTTDLTQYSGPVVARVTEGSIHLSYQVRDDEDQDWMDRERVYSPFQVGFFEPMEFQVTLDGDEIVIDYSPLDQYNPDWLSPEFRD